MTVPLTLTLSPNVYTTKYANPNSGAMLMVMLPYVIYVAKLGFLAYLLSYLTKLGFLVYLLNHLAKHPITAHSLAVTLGTHYA